MRRPPTRSIPEFLRTNGFCGYSPLISLLSKSHVACADGQTQSTTIPFVLRHIDNDVTQSLRTGQRVNDALVMLKKKAQRKCANCLI
jgi:hypothetical protein